MDFAIARTLVITESFPQSIHSALLIVNAIFFQCLPDKINRQRNLIALWTNHSICQFFLSLCLSHKMQQLTIGAVLKNLSLVPSCVELGDESDPMFYIQEWRSFLVLHELLAHIFLVDWIKIYQTIRCLCRNINWKKLKIYFSLWLRFLEYFTLISSTDNNMLVNHTIQDDVFNSLIKLSDLRKEIGIVSKSTLG